jgi:hypothetical protein
MDTTQNLNARFDSIVAEIEPLESLEAASWGEFFGGVSIGLGIVGLVGAGIAIT